VAAVVEPVVPTLELPAERRARPALGYAMVMTAATLWAVNGTVSKVILTSGLSSLRLAEVRSTGAAVVLGAVLAVTRPRTLPLRRRELPLLALFGICGLALVQWLYFLAIHRLKIGIALVIQYMAPVIVALAARFLFHERVRRRIWVALTLAIAGLVLVVEAWQGLTLNQIGVSASLGAAFSYALYILLAEHAVAGRDPVSLVWWGLVFASLLWAVVQPWWSFPGRLFGVDVSLHGHLAAWHLPAWTLMLWMVVLGTIVPFALLVGSLRHLTATRVGIIAMLEPVVATLVAYGWLAESLHPVQLLGGLVVLAGILLAQTAR
jgi:drug/metabolite transporter (DMT)-like permease